MLEKEKISKGTLKSREKRLARVAKFSLDSDNCRTYAARAKANEEKAAAIAEKLPETVDSFSDSGIITSAALAEYENELLQYYKGGE